MRHLGLVRCQVIDAHRMVRIRNRASPSERIKEEKSDVCMYVCMYVYVRMYVCICMYVCMYVYVCVCMCMYVYVCICMYVCICADSSDDMFFQ